MQLQFAATRRLGDTRLSAARAAHLHAEMSEPASIRRAGHAVSYDIWDHAIPEHELDVYESSILLWLYRETFGRGMEQGDMVSIAQVAAGVRCSRRKAAYALNRLSALGLVVRTRKYYRGKRAFAPSWLEVQVAEAPAEPAAGLPRRDRYRQS